MSGFLVAPTEPEMLKSIGKVSSLPEKFGVDVLWMVNGQRWGIQRKEVSDLRASVDDGRLGKELQQIKAASVRAVLVVEGKVSFTTDGYMLKKYGRTWTRGNWWSVLLTTQLEDTWYLNTASLSETVAFAEALQKWSEKDHAGALAARPAPKGIWGTSPTDKDFGVHVLTGFPGIGVELAQRIWDAVGGLPFSWRVGKEDLMKVKGMGKKKVDAIWGLVESEVE